MRSLTRPITDVLIVGEAILGGTVVGSYKSIVDDDQPAPDFLYTWYLDGAEARHTRHFQLRPEHLGRHLVFSVALREPSGRVGPRELSAQKTVTASFQNISREESEASFLKQHGNFSLYSEEPSDRIFVSTGGAFAAIDPKTQKVFVEGENAWGADVPADMLTLFRNNPATRLFSTEKCFAALVDISASANRLLIWGPGIAADQGSFLNVESVYSNRTVFAFIYRNPQGAADRIGAVAPSADRTNGAEIPDSIQLQLAFDAPKAIYATENAFAVLTESGQVHAWGNASSGGYINAFVRQQLDGMTVDRIVATDSAFCATDASGRLVTWGAVDRGGTIPGNVLEGILDDGGVNTVVANRASFLVVTRGRRKAYSFGRAGQGGDMSAEARELAALGNIALCKSSNWAHVICNDHGQFTTWGAPTHSGSTSRSYASRQADLFVRPLGERITATATSVWGSTVALHVTDSSFFLHSQTPGGLTEKVEAWGQVDAGGTLPAEVRQVLENSRIEAVHSTNGAYGVIVTQGEVKGAVVVWGAPLSRGDAGEIPAVLETPLKSGVIELYSIKHWPEREPGTSPVSSSFSARLDNHTYGLWGGNVRDQFYDPEFEPPTLTSIKDDRNNEIPDGHSTESTTVTLSGQAAAKQRVKILDDTIDWGDTDVDTSGSWSITLTDLAAGFHRFRGRGLYGSDPESAERALTITAWITPVLSSVRTASGADIGEASKTTERVFTLTGIASKYQQVRIEDGYGSTAVHLGTATADADGVWSFTTNSRPLGARRFYAKSLYHSGNVYSNVRNFIIEKEIAPGIIAHINIDTRLQRIVLPQDGMRAYVSKEGSGGIYVIDTTTNKLSYTLTEFHGTWGMAINPRGSLLYASTTSASLPGNRPVAVINTNNSSIVATVPSAFSAYGLLLNPSGSILYVAAYSPGNIYVHRASAPYERLASIPMPAVYNLSLNSSGTRLYAIDRHTSGTLAVIDTTTNRLIGSYPIAASGQPHAIACDPHHPRLYVSTGRTVSIFNTNNNALIQTLKFNETAYGIAFNPVKAQAYVALATPSDSLCVIDTRNERVLTYLTGFNYPMGVAVNADGSRAYVTNYMGQGVSVVAL